MLTAKYTEVLYNLLQNPEAKGLIDKALSTYPLYDPTNKFEHMVIPLREEINKKLLDHYKYREIGFETFGRFVDELEIAMNEIMPYYNLLFHSEDIINGLEDIFGNLDVTETFEEERAGTSSTDENVKGTASNHSEGSDTSRGTNTNSSDTKNVASETPQSELSIPANNIDDVSYADKVEWSKTNGEGTTETNGSTESDSNSTNEQDTSITGETSGTTSHTLTRKGNQGVNTYAHDMLEFRRLFRNIIQEIINDDRIKELFMLVY